MLIVALVFLGTWVIPNQVLTVLLIKYPDTDDGAALKLRSMMSIGALEGESFSTAESLAGITAQLNNCLNFFIYAFRHSEFRRHLRFMCGMSGDSSQTTVAAFSSKAGTSPAGAKVI